MTSQFMHTMEETSASPARQPAAPNEDLRFGQVVIVTARWVLIASGFLVAVWNPGPVAQLQVQIITLVVLAFVNFYLLGQLLVKRPVLDAVVYAASVGDLVVITAIVASQGGYESSNYIFYFPAILAFAVSFPRWLTALFAGGAAVVYATMAMGTAEWGVNEQTAVFLRVLTMLAVAACGSLYWGVERDRRAREAQTGGVS